MQNHLQKGIFYTLLSGFLYGTMGYFGTMLIAAGFSIPNMLFWRFLVATVAILIYLLITQPAPLLKTLMTDSKTVLSTVMLGGLFYAFCTLLFFFASEWIGTGLAMVIFFSYPAVVAILMFTIDHHKISFITCFCIAIIILGCIFISSTEHFHFDLYGTVFGILSAVCYGLYVFYSQKKINALDVRFITLFVCIGCATTYMLIAIFTDSLKLPSNLAMWTNILVFGVFSTVLPLLFLLEGLKTISASKASILSVLEPVTTLILGIILLEESATILQFLGVFLVLVSAIIVQFEGKEEEL